MLHTQGDVRTRNFATINPTKHAPTTAAVLLEVAYLSNPETASQLEDGDVRGRLANAISDAMIAQHESTLKVISNMKSVAMGDDDDEIPLEPTRGGMSIDEGSLEVGDIVVSTTGDLISKIIRDFTGSLVSHAALYVGDGMVVEAVASGVELRTLEDALEDDLYAVALRHPAITEDQGMRIRDFAGEQIDRKYDYRAIGMHALYRVAAGVCAGMSGITRAACKVARRRIAFGNDDADRWFCSELVFAAFKAAGVPFGTTPMARTPGGLLTLDPPLEYVGHLKTTLDTMSEGQSRQGRRALGRATSVRSPAHITRSRQSIAPGVQRNLETSQKAASKLASPLGTVPYPGVILPEVDWLSMSSMEILAMWKKWGADYRRWKLGVPDTTFFPHSAICRLEMVDARGNNASGTGFYIGPDKILTCGHNFAYDDWAGAPWYA